MGLQETVRGRGSRYTERRPSWLPSRDGVNGKNGIAC
jgi:hypothetical protein